jgi:hypothetical protein
MIIIFVNNLIIEHKYGVDNPKGFCYSTIGASSLWKRVLWAARAAKMGYQWRVANGEKVKFWEDHWFGTSTLDIQY